MPVAPLRAIQQQSVHPLSVKLLSDEFHAGDTIVVDVENGEWVFRRPSERQGRRPVLRQRCSRAANRARVVTNNSLSARGEGIVLGACESVAPYSSTRHLCWTVAKCDQAAYTV